MIAKTRLIFLKIVSVFSCFPKTWTDFKNRVCVKAILVHSSKQQIAVAQRDKEDMDLNPVLTVQRARRNLLLAYLSHTVNKGLPN